MTATPPASYSSLVRNRRMTRAFRPDPVDPKVVDDLLDLARHAPAAGNTDGREYLVLEGPRQTSGYWETTLPGGRDGFAWPGLLDAPVLVICTVRPDAWVERYAEPDKAATGLGESARRWPVPYWWVDAGMAAMTILHGAAERGLGALFFGTFDHEERVRQRFGVPADRRAVGTIALGHPLPSRPGRSARRSRRGVGELVHRGRW